MGVDAQMLVRTMEAVTAEQVRRWSYELAESFTDAFLTFRPGQLDWMPEGRHALEVVQEYTQDGDSILPAPGETLLEVHLRGRYYGPGYERGDAPLLIAIARWLEEKIPGASIYYGGDSSGRCAEPFGRDQREALWRHFTEHGSRPYRWHRDDAPECEFCCEPLDYIGGGPGYNLFHCAGCDLQLRRYADGRVEEDARRPA